MAARTSILVGPARCGKTSQLLAEFRKSLASGPPGSALWLGPNWAAVRQVRDRLLGNDLAGCASPLCLTFAQLGLRVLDASPAPLRPVTELMKRQLLQELIERGLKEGRLNYFAPIAERSGLLELLSRTIREWKRLEIWPDELANSFQRRGGSPKDDELLWLYREYQEVLNRSDLYDAEGRFWSARARLKSGQRRPFESLRQVYVDGFTDFTRTEYEVLQILSERCEQLAISLPVPSALAGVSKTGTESRQDLFAKPLRALGELRRIFPQASVVALERKPTSWPTMDHIEARLFGPPHDLKPLRESTGVQIIATAGHLNEIEGLARQVKRLLLDGDGRSVRPEEILVVFRSLGDAAALASEVFDRYGIPVSIESSRRVAESATASALVGWLRLAREDWPFRQLLAMLAHNSFAPSWPECLDGKATAIAQQVIRDLQIPAGRQLLLQRLERLSASSHAEPAPAPGSKRDQRVSRARVALPLLHRLDLVLRRLPQTTTATEWIRSLHFLVNELGMSRLIRQSRSEEAAWNVFSSALRSVDRLAGWRGREPERLHRDDVLELLTQVAETETLPAEHDDVGCVRVVGASTARSLSAPYVFLAGLTEKAFPAAEREDGLYSDAEVRQLCELGLPLVTRKQRNQDEMLLFYELVTRATRRLVMSYPGLDAKAQPLSPSPYLVELERACGENRIPHELDLNLSPVPRPDEVFCPRDLRVRAVADGLDGNPQLLSGALLSEAKTTNLLTALETIHDRGRGDSFGPFEGIILSDAARSVLSDRFGPDRCWSASQLERYAYCPFQFFSERILRLEPLAELALEVDYLRRGRLLHGTLTELHRTLRDAGGRLLSPSMQEAADFEQAAQKVLEALVERIRVDDLAAESLREVDRRVLAEWLNNYYAQHQQYDALWAECEEPFRPAHFEVSFGPQSENLDDAEELPIDSDALQNQHPLVVQHGGQAVRVRGRIDRVDVGRIGGKTVFNIIDYKSSSEIRLNEETIVSGRTLQLPLYALAVEQLLLADREALPWKASYWLVKEKGFRHRTALSFYQYSEGTLELDESWAAVRDQLVARVVSLVQGIRDGQFPMHCADEHCTSRCQFNTICRVGHVRSLAKNWNPPEAGK